MKKNNGKKILKILDIRYLIFISLCFTFFPYQNSLAAYCKCGRVGMIAPVDCYVSDTITQKDCVDILNDYNKSWNEKNKSSDIDHYLSCTYDEKISCETIASQTKGKVISPKPIQEKIKWAPIAPTLQINIPTLQPFTTKGMTQPDVEGYVYIPFIGQYIAAIYTWAVGIAGLIAVVLIITGGFMYLTSAGNAQRTQDAKDRISSALFGLLLLLASYVLLYTINPDLVKFKSLRIKIIERKMWDSSIAGGEAPSVAGNCGGANGKQQTLAADLGLSGDVFQYASYSTKYGSSCDKPITIKAITLHYTASDKSSTAAGVVKFWSNLSSSPGVICQIIADRDGKNYQITEKIEEHVICQGSTGGFNYNDGGVGIEIMGADTDELLSNDKQKKSVIELVSKIANKYNIPKTNSVDNLLNGTGGIFTHQQITKCEGAPNQKTDPGEKYAKEIIEGAGGTYTDWTTDARCNK